MIHTLLRASSRIPRHELLDAGRRRPERTVDVFALGAILNMLLGGMSRKQ